jgi:hypothetical protein
MDKLAKQLREDADQVEILISAELDDRIRASLHSASQERVPATDRRPASFWWASSLTGVAATLAVVAIVNLNGPEPEIGITEPAPTQFAVANFDWNLQPAVLTETLEQELVDFQADLKKAEQAVRSDLADIL